MRLPRAIVPLIVVFSSWAAPAVAQEGAPWSICLFGSFTSSSKLFHHPTAPDANLRQRYLPLANTLGGGLDIRYELLALRLQIGLSAEILAEREPLEIPTSGGTAPATDGYVAVPVELTALFRIPVGSDRLRLTMGGGGGVYFGERRYEVAGIRAETLDRTPGGGIHITSGLQVQVLDWLSLRAEMKFRDIQFTSENAFPTEEAIWEGTPLSLDTQPFTSRLHVDGMNLALGLVVPLR